MTSRFKTSKFRNATVRQHKREEWYLETATSSQQTDANHIKASNSFVAATWDGSAGGNIGILPLNATGKRSGSVPLIRAHSDFISDFDFSPFHDSILASGSNDATVKLWSIPENGVTDGTFAPTLTLDGFEKRIEWLQFHPSADEILAIAEGKRVHVADLQSGQNKLVLEGFGDTVQCLAWNNTGNGVVATSKDKIVRLLDARTGTVSGQAEAHQGQKSSRVIWLGEHDFFLTTGFGKMRERQYALWDPRNITKAVTTVSLDSSTGGLIPLFDADTNMLFIGGKGDTSIRYLEFSPTAPHFAEGANHLGDTPQLGLAMLPKRSVNVMGCEIVRLLKLTRNAIVPVSYDVPRKTYYDFHEDLYPDTNGSEPAVSAAQWLAGEDGTVSKISLNPSKRPATKPSSTPAAPSSNTRPAAVTSAPATPAAAPSPTPVVAAATSAPEKPAITTNKPTALKPKTAASAPVSAAHSGTASPVPEVERTFQNSAEVFNEAATPASPSPVITSADSSRSASTAPNRGVNVVRSSAFRHILCTEMHKSNNYDSLTRVNQALSGECNGIEANPQFLAFPVDGPGGQICVLEVKNPRRIGVELPTIQNSSAVSDFKWDPFDNCSLAVACEDGSIRLWSLPSDGIEDGEVLDEPTQRFFAHDSRSGLLLYHPLVKDLLLSTGSDGTCKLWNLSEYDIVEPVRQFEGHTDSIFGASYNYDGSLLATTCKDKTLRIFDVYTGKLIEQFPGAYDGVRGARVAWCGNSDRIVISCFDKTSARQLRVFDLAARKCIAEETLDVSPAVLALFFDEDTNVVYCTGKGDTTILLFEINGDAPYLHPLSPSKAGTGSVGFAFLPKSVVDVAEVETIRALKLTKNSVVKLQFTVPRTKKQFFQDDIFPPTRCKWSPALQVSEFLEGSKGALETVDLCPKGMVRLSDAPKEAPKAAKYATIDKKTFKTDAEKKAELVAAMVDKLGNQGPEEMWEDKVEGVDASEWD